MKIIGKRRVYGRYFKTWAVYVKSGCYYACVLCKILNVTDDKRSIITCICNDGQFILPNKTSDFKKMSAIERWRISELCEKEIKKIL